MQVTTRQIGSVLVLSLDGELLSPVAAAFLQAARRIVSALPSPMVAVDLNGVPRLDASGFGALVSLLRHLQRRQGGLCLVGVRSEVRILLEIMQLHLLFEVCTDVDEAMAVLQGASANGHGPGANGHGPAPARGLEPSRTGYRPLEERAAS
jgi:anti-sigma B factor antagonist